MSKTNAANSKIQNFADMIRQHLNSLSNEDLSCPLGEISQQYHIDEHEWKLTHPQAISCGSDRY